MLIDPTRSSHPALSLADNVAMSTGDFLLLAGRIMLGWIFLRGGFPKMFDIPAVAASYPTRGLMPALAWIAVPAEFFGGLALILGFATRYFAVVLIIFVIVASFSSHAYWNFTDAAARRIQESNFWRNSGILAGIFFLFVCGAGRLSLDRWLANRSASRG